VYPLEQFIEDSKPLHTITFCIISRLKHNEWVYVFVWMVTCNAAVRTWRATFTSSSVSPIF